MVRGVYLFQNDFTLEVCGYRTNPHEKGSPIRLFVDLLDFLYTGHTLADPWNVQQKRPGFLQWRIDDKLIFNQHFYLSIDINDFAGFGDFDAVHFGRNGLQVIGHGLLRRFRIALLKCS